MKVLLYGINFAPELTGIGKYSGEMAAWLATRGHDLDVVTAPPYYPEWKVHAGFTGSQWQRHSWGPDSAVQVTRCPLWMPGRISGKTRLVHLASFALSSFLPLVSAAIRKPSLMVVVVPTLATAPLALLVARLWGIPVWLHVQDFELDAMLGMGLVSGGGRSKRWATALESWVLRRFDRVSSISPKMLTRLQDKGVVPAKVVDFPNWVDLDAIHPLQGPNPLRAELGLQGNNICVLYSGNMGEKQGIEVVIEAARQLTHRSDIQFIICGAGAAMQRLKAAAVGIGCIQWHPLQPLEKLNDLLNAADIHVLPQRAEAADLVMPSKLTGMLASGRAIVGTAHANTSLGQVLAECCVRVDPDDASALAAAIASLADDPARRNTLGLSGRRYAETHLGRDAILQRIEAQMQSVMEQS
jgi:colanic acid biosynthesis glycosyl transferase WcaI